MLTYRWVESNSGPPRKYFSLTEKGQAFYNELEATWKELANAVNTLAKKDGQHARYYQPKPILLTSTSKQQYNEKDYQYKFSGPGDSD